MATRPVFVPASEECGFVVEVLVDFEWYPGFSIAQKQRSIESLHAQAMAEGINRILEISSKSVESLGVRLSAFNLALALEDGRERPLECVFQGSKKFIDQEGPFVHLYDVEPIDAKRYPGLKESGELESFMFKGFTWPLEPKTVFYDWLYVNALAALPPDDQAAICELDGFTDIEFNPKKSFSCQARSAAVYVALERERRTQDVLQSPEIFISLFSSQQPPSQTVFDWS